jgi:TldD protein
LNYDDEGCATQVTPLIEEGIMTGIMTDRMNAHLLGLPLTGNGRRESYACRPLPRMTNTLMLPGESDPQAMLATLDKGIYAVNFSGGQVDTASGQFVFSLSQAYWVEKGRILHPIKGATLIGSGVEVMQNIIAVGNDFKMDPGIGVCGKEGQSVPVGVGQPSVQLRHITVGGTQR